MLSVSCAKEGQPALKTGSPMVIRAYTNEMLSRTALKDNGKGGYDVVWSTNDLIQVGGITFRLNKGAGTTSGEFVAWTPGTLTDGVQDAYFSITGKTLKGTQSFYAGKIQAAPMYAQVTVSEGVAAPVQFKNLCGLLRITVTGSVAVKVKSIEFSADEPVAGPFDIVSGAAVINSTDPKTSLTVDCTNGSDYVPLSGEGTDFYIALPAGSYHNTHIVIKDVSDNVLVDKTLKSKTLDIVRAEISGAEFSASLAPVAVDMGFPSGMKWASCNIGASFPEEAGSTFAWNKSTDYAANEWGGAWRMPNYDEMDEFFFKTKREWTDDYRGTGAKGYICYKKKAEEDATYTLSDTHIFMPVGNYWTSTDNPTVYSGTHAYALCLPDNNLPLQSISYGLHEKTEQFFIRPVCR